MNELDILNKKYGGIVTAIHRGRYVKYSGGEMDDKFFETLDEKYKTLPRESFKESVIWEGQLLNEEGSFYSPRIHTGGDASENRYTDAYIKIFEHLKDVRFHFLEIGIFQGRSLAMWSDYFKNATINGIDINTKEFYLTKPELEKMSAFTNNNLGLIEQIDTTQNMLTEIGNCFRIIIDDGNHAAEAQWATFKNYFPFLCSGGIYVVEDVNKNWAEKFKNEMLKLRDNDEDCMSIFKVIKDIEVIECNEARLLVIKRR